ncbi:MAG: formylglycine-generating enzyme family protein [Nitrospirae bacterium]|nr:formylglycine-generating enzyme family protein [Nitrospirota bacterium]
MRQRMRGTVLGVMLIVAGTVAGTTTDAHAEVYHAIPGLSAKDRVVLAKSMVEQGQFQNGLIEITEAMKEMPNDEMLIRLKGICETELLRPEAKDTIMKWLELAPQNHPDRAKMLAFLARTQAPAEASIDWLLVPAGEFEMGAEGGLAEPDEGPKHRVNLDAFYIGKYEVTNRQYQTFVKASGHHAPENEDPKFNLWRGDKLLDGVVELPVVNVSWEDAAAYCKWVGGRLPTEAEWEKAARGTDGRTYPWGNEPVTGNRANYSFDPVPMWDGTATLAKKDQYEFGRSPYGAYEMAGNVWEWVQDWYDENYYKNSPAKNPTGPADGQQRGMRGGSWRNNAEKLRVANRSRQPPTDRRVYIGIRCAKDATDVK